MKNEDRYEIVNNIRVLQPKYLRGTEKFVFERNIDRLHSNKLLKRINESFVFQQSVTEISTIEEQQRKQMRTRNGFSEGVDF